MGMTSDQNVPMTFSEMQEMKRREEAQKAKKRVPYTLLGVITVNDRLVKLILGDDKKWYKSEYIRSERLDKKNRTPVLDIFSDEISPLTKEEWDSYFSLKNVKRGKKN